MNPQVAKESGDALNPPVVASGVEIASRRARTTGDHLALAIATCGVGYIPLAPGTWGSALGVGIYLLLRAGFVRIVADVAGSGLSFTSLLLAVIALVTGVGIWAGTRAEKLLGRKDPGAVVVDEVSGQLITFIFLPLSSPAWTIITGFLVFRALDIGKPYPIRRLEALGLGLGIMADDVLAGMYAATLLLWVVLMYSFFLL